MPRCDLPFKGTEVRPHGAPDPLPDSAAPGAPVSPLAGRQRVYRPPLKPHHRLRRAPISRRCTAGQRTRPSRLEVAGAFKGTSAEGHPGSRQHVGTRQNVGHLIHSCGSIRTAPRAPTWGAQVCSRTQKSEPRPPSPSSSEPRPGRPAAPRVPRPHYVSDTWNSSQVRADTGKAHSLWLRM